MPTQRRIAFRLAKRAGGFTLIELLAVIAVIAILASALVPLWSRAVGQARQTQCSNQLHAIAMAGFCYIADYRCYPPDCYGDNPWPIQFLYYAKGANMFNCPDAPACAQWNGSPFTAGYGDIHFGYAVCCWGVSDYTYLSYWVPPGNRPPGRGSTEIAVPSDYYWVADSNCGLPENDNGPYGPWDLIFEVHLYDWCAPYEWVGTAYRWGRQYALCRRPRRISPALGHLQGGRSRRVAGRSGQVATEGKLR